MTLEGFLETLFKDDVKDVLWRDYDVGLEGFRRCCFVTHAPTLGVNRGLDRVALASAFLGGGGSSSSLLLGAVLAATIVIFSLCRPNHL